MESLYSELNKDRANRWRQKKVPEWKKKFMEQAWKEFHEEKNKKPRLRGQGESKPDKGVY